MVSFFTLGNGRGSSDWTRSKICYKMSIAFANHSVDRSLFTHLIDRDPSHPLGTMEGGYNRKSNKNTRRTLLK